jgi:hypothetical protein
LLQRASIADGKLIISLSTPGAAGAAVCSAPPAALWDYPRTPAQAIRYRVFADLHARGCVSTREGIRKGLACVLEAQLPRLPAARAHGR